MGLAEESFAALKGCGVEESRFVPGSGAVVDPALVIVDDLIDETEFETKVIESGAVITALISEVGKPVRGDVFYVSGNSWKVNKRIPSTDQEVVILHCHNDGAT